MQGSFWRTFNWDAMPVPVSHIPDQLEIMFIEDVPKSELRMKPHYVLLLLQLNSSTINLALATKSLIIIQNWMSCLSLIRCTRLSFNTMWVKLTQFSKHSIRLFSKINILPLCSEETIEKEVKRLHGLGWSFPPLATERTFKYHLSNPKWDKSPFRRAWSAQMKNALNPWASYRP